MDGATRDLRIDIAVSGQEAEALERALLKARASELSEVKRRNVRLTAGYGDPTNRDVMDDEARSAQLGYDVLTTLLDALRVARAR